MLRHRRVNNIIPLPDPSYPRLDFIPTLLETYKQIATDGNGKRQSVALSSETAPVQPAAAASSLANHRIIFVLGNLELGGAERQALILARYLSEHEQAKVEVWGFNKSGPVAQICEQHGLRSRVVAFPSGQGALRRWLSLLRFGWSLRRAKPDLILPYTLFPNVVCGLVWKWTGARACIWNQRDEGLFALKPRWQRAALKRIPRFIANSEAGAQFLRRQLGDNGAKVTVIPNGIENGVVGLDRSEWRERLEVDEECFVACKVANVHANKDHETLLRAWRKVVSELHPNGRSAVLVLAGRHDGAYESVVALAKELDIERSVRFVGQVSDVPGLLSAADVSVFSSRSEGCPNGVLESMGAGLAIAATNIDGIREVVGPAGLQFLAPVGDADALAEILLRMADDPRLCARIGAENRERVQAKYGSRRMCEETVAVLANRFRQ